MILDNPVSDSLIKNFSVMNSACNEFEDIVVKRKIFDGLKHTSKETLT